MAHWFQLSAYLRILTGKMAGWLLDLKAYFWILADRPTDLLQLKATLKILAGWLHIRAYFRILLGWLATCLLQDLCWLIA